MELQQERGACLCESLLDVFGGLTEVLEDDGDVHVDYDHVRHDEIWDEEGNGQNKTATRPLLWTAVGWVLVAEAFEYRAPAC